VLWAEVEDSPLAGGRTRIAYREWGAGSETLIILHGGWGYEVYPFTAQAEAVSGFMRVIAPDRSGYGHSTPIDSWSLDFHRRAAAETVALLDSLGIERAVWWGHSDGAVVAAWAAIIAPSRISALILEAFHLYRCKASSTPFFEQMARDPDGFGPRIAAVLERDHGERWREPLRIDGALWLELVRSAVSPIEDLYDGRLAPAAAGLPVLLLHGSQDPRSEPGELEAARRLLPHATLVLVPGGGHSPHSEPASADLVTDAVRAFLSGD
jgi:3-oxoadipate enol-lactonase